MSSTTLARTVVTALTAWGITDVVLAPGSRNAPLSFALLEAERRGQLRLHVRIDERSAAFLALGLAKGLGRPAAVVCTSGTAVANLHPAVVEASYSRTPLLALTANRPLSMQGTGVNQTIDQVGIFGSAVRAAHHVADDNPEDWPASISAALDALVSADLGPGPVQLDLGFSLPLIPDGATAVPVGSPAPARERRTAIIDVPPRTLVIVAETTDAMASTAIESALAEGFPVHVEAGTALRHSGPGCLEAGAFLVGSAALLGKHRPEHLVVVGRPTLARHIPALLADDRIAVTMVSDHAGWSNPQLTGVPPIIADSAVISGRADGQWAASWRAVDGAVRDLVERAATDPLDAGSVLAAIADDADPDLLVVASSNPIRDLDQRAFRLPHRVIVNRGAAGIDGLVSTAIGAALAMPQGSLNVAVLGDLALLHDSNGLIIGPEESRPDLTIVVCNNRGGAIFASLEQGAAEYADAFERLFGTPHDVAIDALCAATATPYTRVATRAELLAALAAADGIRVVEVPLDRTDERARRAALSRSVEQLIADTLAG